MNYETQAKNGFKTFVITLSISLVIFSAAYYLITDISGNVDIESYEASAQENVAFEANKSSSKSSDVNVKGISTTLETTSVFGEINQNMAPAPAVLQAADTTDDTTVTTTEAEETLEATVPDTGSETLIGTILGVGFTAIAAYMVLVGPKKMALVNFEQNVIKNIEDES